MPSSLFWGAAQAPGVLKAPHVVPTRPDLRTTSQSTALATGQSDMPPKQCAGHAGAEALATVCAVPRAGTDFPWRGAGTGPAEKAVRPVTALQENGL